jgi:hypothetical protein
MCVTLKTRESLVKNFFGKAGSISTYKATLVLIRILKEGNGIKGFESQPGI